MTPIKIHNVPIGKVLLTRGLITREQLDAALAIQERSQPKKKIATVLIEMGAITQEAADACLQQQIRLDETPLTEAIAMLRQVVGEPLKVAERRRQQAADIAARVGDLIDRKKNKS